MALLSKARQEEIDRKISEVLMAHNLSYPDNGLLEITMALGIDVYASDLSDFGADVSGAIKRGGEGERSQIILNKNQSKERITFTLAHELGHYFLHNGDKLRIDKYNYHQNSTEALEESEANYFAASLLMPETEFLKLYKDSEDIEAVSKYFGVSIIAAKNRLRWISQN